MGIFRVFDLITILLVIKETLCSIAHLTTNQLTNLFCMSCLQIYICSSKFNQHIWTSYNEPTAMALESWLLGVGISIPK